MTEPQTIKTYQEIADEIIDCWVEQLRTDATLIKALGSGRKVDVTVKAIARQVMRPPDIVVWGDTRDTDYKGNAATRTNHSTPKRNF